MCLTCLSITYTRTHTHTHSHCRCLFAEHYSNKLIISNGNIAATAAAANYVMRYICLGTCFASIMLKLFVEWFSYYLEIVRCWIEATHCINTKRMLDLIKWRTNTNAKPDGIQPNQLDSFASHLCSSFPIWFSLWQSRGKKSISFIWYSMVVDPHCLSYSMLFSVLKAISIHTMKINC